jgi:hypothetical protein
MTNLRLFFMAGASAEVQGQRKRKVATKHSNEDTSNFSANKTEGKTGEDSN